MSINWPAPCWLHHMERSGCNLWDRPGHSARELEMQAAGDILICAAMCKGMHLQPGSVPVIRLASVFLEERRSRKTWRNRTRPRKYSDVTWCYSNIPPLSKQKDHQSHDQLHTE